MSVFLTLIENLKMNIKKKIDTTFAFITSEIIRIRIINASSSICTPLARLILYFRSIACFTIFRRAFVLYCLKYGKLS